MEHYLSLVGVIVQTVIFLLGGYALYVANNTRQKLHTDALREDVKGMKEELKGLAEVITVQAVQSTRLDHMYSQLLSVEKRVEDMRRGKGYVRERATVDGEYEAEP